MDKILIYIKYNQYDYINYFHLIVNDKVVDGVYLEEEIDTLFKIIIEKEKNGQNFELYIVQDKDASNWDFLKKIQEYGIKIQPLSNKNTNYICEILNSLFDGEYEISDKDNVFNKKIIRVLFSGNCFLKRNECSNDEVLKQAEEILKSGGEERTKLASIIIEKYERMNKHE